MTYRVRYKTRVSYLLHDDRADAVKEGEDSKEEFHLERVRPPKLSDFILWPVVFGDMRERMAERLGDDSLMDSGPLANALRSGKLESLLSEYMDTFCEEQGIVLEGAIVTGVEKP